MKNWYRVTYTTSGGNMLRLIRAHNITEALDIAQKLSPEAQMFDAVLIPQGIRTK